MSVDDEWFPDLVDDFEESVRIDREGSDHRTSAIESYHVTSDSERFIDDFVTRLLGQADDLRTGSSYWLYGYYGSGKSHLLTVLEGLVDTSWLEDQQDDVWRRLVPDSRASEEGQLDQLRRRWHDVHDEYHVIPISVNLLKYQGQKQRSFSEIILSHAHQNEDLTGVEDDISRGLSSQVDVAYFEDWYRTTDAWEERQQRAEAVLEDITGDSPNYDWKTDDLWEDIQEYSALADVALPELFEEVTGTQDGYRDLQPSDIDPEAVISRLETLRSAREDELEKPVKLVLLLDEVSLFIGTDFERLTELQTLAENVKEIGDGNIHLVATAQAKIEDVQPKFAAHGASFSIVKDRFPHRYQLPSKHVGDIAKRRLFRKSEAGEDAVQQVLDSASVQPTESLVYNEIKQNTKPPLDGIDDDELVEFYPFLPYHAPLFLEILFNLRREASDPAKSIFSGTARAILALMHGLLDEWVENGEPDQLISLVDFYEMIEPELRDILAQDIRVIEGTDATRGIKDEVDDGDLTEFDLKVAKAVLLLRHVHDIVPLNEGNIAVAVMSDLNGRSWISTTNRVEESLDRLKKFIRPTQEESGPQYRFATAIERRIYEDAEQNEANPDWEAVLETLDEHLWRRIAQELPLPDSVPYGESGDEYPVTYDFSLDGTDFETTIEAEGGLDVHIAIQGLYPDETPESGGEDTLHWTIDSEGLENLRKRLVEWWALRVAVADYDVPPAVKRDLEQRADAVRSGLVNALRDGSYTVKDQRDITGLTNAVQRAVDVAYPDDFHPMMLQVDEARLKELRKLTTDDTLPPWAQTIQVPATERAANGGKQTIQSNVMALTGRQLKDKDGALNLNTIIDGIVEQKPFYDEARPALRAIIWGLCRKGRFVPVNEAGETLANEAVLDPGQSSTTRLKLLPRNPIGDWLEDGGFKETTETVSEGLINLREANQHLQSKFEKLHEDVELTIDTDVHADAVATLLQAFADELAHRSDAIDERLSIISAQDERLKDEIEQTNRDQEWFEEVSDVWEIRLPSLYRLDTVLTIGDEEFEWVDEDTYSSIGDRRETIATFEGEWWTTDGWSTFSEELVPDLSSDLQNSWAEFTARNEFRELVDQVDDHSWIVQAIELPAGIHRSFEREFISPLREVQRWYETLDETLETLSSEDTASLADASDAVADLEPLGETTDVDPAELRIRLDRLNSIVGGRSPAEVDQIGIVPDDRQSLDRYLESLVEGQDLTIQSTETGVIIQ